MRRQRNLQTLKTDEVREVVMVEEIRRRDLANGAGRPEIARIGTVVTETGMETGIGTGKII